MKFADKTWSIMKIIENIHIKIEETEVLRYFGYPHKKEDKVSEIILEITKKAIVLGYCLFESKGIYSKVMIKNINSEGRINFKNGLHLEINNSMLNLLKGTSCLVFGISTIGNSLEDKVAELFAENEYPQAIALDAVGIVATKFASNYIQGLVYQEAKEQKIYTTKYFSPGSGNWNINQQENIFQIIQADKIGIQLNDSYMMIPKKSLSWVIGIEKKTTIKHRGNNSCDSCLAKNCQFRRSI